ncbi:MAG: S-methyl-5-thioribose-1-phosphate isomerase [Candidatus Omnitrophica bacterium]|nr:S-methyl-5-thioribose-1-phosphate isomerase [Candidatus Omnitrophota bacterium]
MIETLRWKKKYLEMIDQRLLPGKFIHIKCFTQKDVFDAIKKMIVRGAPAIGIAGAYGVYLGISQSKAKSWNVFYKDLRKTAKYIASSRPTARNLFWAIERIEKTAIDNKEKTPDKIKSILLKECHKILEQDKIICRKLGEYGSALIKKDAVLLTHCNAGALATADYGTALAPMYTAKKNIKKVYVDETRPVLQGARLTAWELTRAKIPAILICDNMAAVLMAKRKVDAIFVGADRISANGDVANKIGTYSLAVNAKYHKVPFYVVAPASTFDLSLKNGDGIPIEQRESDEVRKVLGNYISPKHIDVYNPSFDVTPAELISAIVTEFGVIKDPDNKKIKAVLGKGNG